MSSLSSAPLEAAPAAEPIPPDAIVIQTRFGRFAFDPAQAIEFPRGVLGFPAHRSFGLTALPDARLRQFMLLQSLTDTNLSFLVLPVTGTEGPIAPADIASAREALGISAADLAVILIVSIRKVGGETQVSVNLRAPILMDAARRTGAQVVLSNGDYPVRHVLLSRPAPDPAAACAAVK
jgi:flagellar assembly factor FliW